MDTTDSIRHAQFRFLIILVYSVRDTARTFIVCAEDQAETAFICPVSLPLKCISSRSCLKDLSVFQLERVGLKTRGLSLVSSGVAVATYT